MIQKTERGSQGSEWSDEGIRSPSSAFGIQILGILNITEDSFSDGAKYLDVGAASSNPESTGVPPEVEIARLEPVVAAFEGAAISVDTYSLTVQRWALAHDVAFINDIQGFPDAALYPALAASSAKLIVMHSVQERGGATRVDVPPEAIMTRICTYFDKRVAALERAGIARARLILDPGMGFFLGTNPETSFTVLRRLPELKARFGLPTLVSVSRKSFLRRLTGRSAVESGGVSLAAELFAIRQGADYIRTHAPGPLRDALLVEKALNGPL